MLRLAQKAGTTLDYQVETQWQPVEAQRALLWASRFGLGEEFVHALNVRHFTQRKSAVHRSTILEAAEEASLDVNALVTFLDTDELADVVWKSYGDTIKKHGIHAIPWLYFNNDGPSLTSDGGPYGGGARHEGELHQGSGSVDTFYALFLRLMERETKGEVRWHPSMAHGDDGDGGACML